MNSQEKQKQVEDLQVKHDAVKVNYDELWRKKQSEIKIIEDKYEKEITNFQTELDGYKKEINDAQNEKRQLIIDEEWQEALSRGVINEFYLMSMATKAGLDRYWIEEVTQKKTLPNGIETWMIFSNGTSPFKFYLAFYEGALVGVSFRQHAQHAGDPTLPYSFIGQFDEPLQAKKYNEIRKKDYYVNATFTEWTKELKSLNLDEANLLPMNAETLEEIKLGTRDYWYEWNWSSKPKQKTA